MAEPLVHREDIPIAAPRGVRAQRFGRRDPVRGDTGRRWQSDPAPRRRWGPASHDAAASARDRNRQSQEAALNPCRKVIHISMEDYVPRPLDLITDAWVTDANARYVYRFLSYRDPHGIWFPVHTAPDADDWEIVDANPKIMHCVYGNKRVVLWMVGVLVDSQLVVNGVSRPSQLRVVIDFLREHDRTHALRLYNSAASVPFKLANMDLLSVSSPSSLDEGLPTYCNVFDARRDFCARSLMDTVPLACILVGDIVLVECALIRTEGPDGLYQAAFVCDALHWLIEKPRPGPAIEGIVPEFPMTISAE